MSEVEQNTNGTEEVVATQQTPRPNPQQLVHHILQTMNIHQYSAEEAKAVGTGLAAELMLNSFKVNSMEANMPAGEGRMVYVRIDAELLQRVPLAQTAVDGTSDQAETETAKAGPGVGDSAQ